MIKEIFSEANGQLSSMRVNSFIALLVAIGITVHTVLNGEQAQNFNVILLWLTAGLVPKCIQRFAEKK